MAKKNSPVPYPMANALNHDDLDIVDDDDGGTGTAIAETGPAWKIMVVDDDVEVHNATVFALQDVRIDGRPLNFLHAYTGDDAFAQIGADDEIAVVILDVVMERENAGLQLVRRIREELGNATIRIILRTGQPGYAPEMRVIREYDINDYKTKSELTRVRLVTTLTTAVRSYHHLKTVIAARRGLAKIVELAAEMFAFRDVAGFSAAAARGATELVGGAADACLCSRQSGVIPSDRPDHPRFAILGEARRLAPALSATAPAPPARLLVERCLHDRTHASDGNEAAFFIAGGKEGIDAALFLRTALPLTQEQSQLIEVYCANIGVGLENAGLIADLRFSAFSDPLTRLANRAGFVQRIDDRLRAGQKGWTLALIDIDHFSELNDALGHHKGDRLLLAVAQRLAVAITQEMTLARITGDVFGIFGPDTRLDPRELLDHFRRPFAVDDYSLPVQATIGLARLDDAAGSDGIDLLKATNIALNRAKTSDRGRWHYYTQDMAAATRSRLDLLHDLRLAVVNQRGIELHYQPQIELTSGRVIGAEALIRWRGADGKFIRPDLFISLAEYSGLIVDLGAWVFRTAVHELGNWDAQGLSGIRMAINVSLVQFRDPLFIQRARSALAETGIAASRIELEITESVAMLDEETVVRTLEELKLLGFQIAIDDFGTGFSSLSYLHRLPIDRLKIDRSFVREVDSRTKHGASIAQTVIRLGQSLGLSVLAEGIETEAQAQLLMDLGCPQAQGFLYSPPIDSAAFVAWWRLRQSH